MENISRWERIRIEALNHAFLSYALHGEKVQGQTPTDEIINRSKRFELFIQNAKSLKRKSK